MTASADVAYKVLSRDHNLPLVIEPAGDRAEVNADALISWHSDNRDFAEQKLLEHGAILFRGFNIRTPSAFSRFVKSVSNNLLGYVDGNSPRTKITDGIYTSTEYPAEFFISLHNELSYSKRWPSKLFFCCIVAPREGGATPIADCRAILKSLPSEIVESFASKRVRYVRNLHGGRGLGISWQDTFETDDRDVVEKFCSEASIDFEWRYDGWLRLTQVGPGVETHPATGEKVWFNQADQFHPSNNQKDVFESLKAINREGEDNFPQNACFGDGTAIDASMLDRVRETVRQHMVCFPWQDGDILMLDNMLTCHGRMPYKGPRKVLVSML